MYSEKVKARSGTFPEQVVDSEKVKARLGTLIGAKPEEVRRIVVDLARVEPGTAKAGPGEFMDMEARRKGGAIIAVKHKKLKRKRQMRKRRRVCRQGRRC